MAELPPGYNDVPEEDRKKAQSFFVHANSLAGSGQFDYSVSMFLDGLKLDPDAVDAHQKLRETSLKRKASGGKGLGMLEALKLKKATKDDKENLLNAEKLLAFDPGNTDHMLAMAQNAARAGYYDTVLWIGQVMMEAERDSAKPSASRFLALRDVYKKLEQFQLAADAAEYALRMKPGDIRNPKTPARACRPAASVRLEGISGIARQTSRRSRSSALSRDAPCRDPMGTHTPAEPHRNGQTDRRDVRRSPQGSANARQSRWPTSNPKARLLILPAPARGAGDWCGLSPRLGPARRAESKTGSKSE